MFKNFLKTIKSIFLLFITFLLLSDCSGSLKNKNSVCVVPGTTAKNQRSFSSKDLKEKEFKEILTNKEVPTKNTNKEVSTNNTNKKNNVISLVPATKQNSNIWINLTTKNGKYMQPFFQNKKALTKDQATYQLYYELNEMWITGRKPPNLLFFIVVFNGNRVGIIKCVGLTDSKTALISYITAKKYARQGIATNALKMLINLIKHLNEIGVYNCEYCALWIFNDNLASIRVAEKNGFVPKKENSKEKKKKYVLEIKSSENNEKK
ncbi:MAG: GNAT family N-acetyltransferase [Oscillospiraceae bacterium]|jgi:RimJ/RimL family protein N-acetyltransferase|nr:GNAT family N-acetyltransferase [Oscillospiraceae bacterium]